MQFKISLKWSLLIVIAVIAIISILISRGYFMITPSDSLQYGQVIIDAKLIEQFAPKEKSTLGLPVRLLIPSINVDTTIESVGLTSKGAMDTPKSFANAAWFNLGVKPGEEGSSVIDGHSGWKNGKQSVFDGLNKIKKGDKIYVEDEKRLISVFIVREFRTYSLADDASDIFSSNDGKAHLNLITCVGAWYVNQKSPNDRFVVFSDKE